MTESTTATPEALSVDEAAKVLGISRALAYEGVRRGEIPSVRIGSRILIPRRGLDAMLAGVHTVPKESLETA